MSVPAPTAQATRGPSLSARVFAVGLLSTALLPLGVVRPSAAALVGHLVISEVVTGGASATDELIEVYNPSDASLPLEGLELVYVSASGLTVSRRAAWTLGAAEMPAGSHVLVANELGLFAPIADAVYASGMAAAGGSVALRIEGASSAIDAVGWGTATGAWIEGTPVVAPPAGSSIERMPGGALGSTTDTENNASDFAVRAIPDPQNAGSPPVPDPTEPSPVPSPVPTPTPTPFPTDMPEPTATPVPTDPPLPTGTPAPTATPLPTETAVPTGTPGPTPISIAAGRGLADGSVVTIEGLALTTSDFADGGGFIADESGGVAVLVDLGSYARGALIRATGILDDRFAQRTIRAAGSDVRVTGTADEPAPIVRTTGLVDESVEGRLVLIGGMIEGGATVLSAGLAFDVDDGSGVARVIVLTATGIDTAGWASGRHVEVVGVVGQRDSSGTGLSGYRIQPRDAADVVLGLEPSPTPSPSSSPTPEPTPSASPTPSDDPPAGVSTIAEARAAAKNARLTVRGVVTLASGTIDAASAVIQDGSAAILLRLGDDAGTLSGGQLVEVEGARSTKAGMESLRVTLPPRQIGSGDDPAPLPLRTGDAGQSGEAVEAQLVVVRGALVASARKASSGTVSFEIDDGSGPLRVVLGSEIAAADDALVAGSWVEVRGVLGQDTTGAQPLRGYRVWPREIADVRITAGATGVAADEASAELDGRVSPSDTLEVVGSAGLADLRVAATLVLAGWPELDLAGLLWDGTRLVGVESSSAPRLAQVMDKRSVPAALALGGMRGLGIEARLGLPVVALGSDHGDVVAVSRPPAAPRTTLPGAGEQAAWVSVIGRVGRQGDRLMIEVAGVLATVEGACEADPIPRAGVVAVTGVGLADPARIVVACGAISPTPALALGAASTDPRLRPPGPSEATAVDTTAASAMPRRVLAGALLVIPLIVLALVALARLRRRVDNADASPISDVVAGEEVDESADLRRPTLVRLPREHESP